jgi:hypothetical protein
MPWIQINSLDASPHVQPAHVAATMYKFDDNRPYLQTNDYGKTWKDRERNSRALSHV